MEALTTAISIALILGLLLAPILIFIRTNRSHSPSRRSFIYLILCFVLTAGLTMAFAWWAHYSTELLMSHYGYDFEAMGDADRFREVKSESVERVKSLELSHFGIGWPLKAINMYELYAAYPVVVISLG